MTTVLIVEDDQDLLENIGFDLEMCGYSVRRAGDGSAALAILEGGDPLPDIIVSDISMPGIDGFHLLEAIRAHPGWEQIPFLFLTAYNSLSSLRISKELGADDYIVKPFHAEDLVLAMENKLRRARAYQEAAQRQLESARIELLNMMSHELRTPLMAIFGGMGLLRDHLSESTDPFVHSMLRLILNGATRMNRLTTNALTLVQFDSGQMDALFEKLKTPTDLQKCIDQALQAVDNDSDLKDRGVTVQREGETGPLLVIGLAQCLTMIVEELLRNAIAFSARGGAISLRVTCEGGQAAIEIQDSGTGMTPEALAKVWGRFAQVNRKQHEQQGAGLGLPLVWACTRLHSGICTLESAPKAGTTARVTLPLAPADASATAS